jgi:hypothetical protein
VTFPTIHLNGTHGPDLADNAAVALEALRAASHAHALTAPNARDYYVQGTDAFDAARREYLARVEQLQAVTLDVAMLLENLTDQIAARRARGTR